MSETSKVFRRVWDVLSCALVIRTPSWTAPRRESRRTWGRCDDCWWEEHTWCLFLSRIGGMGNTSIIAGNYLERSDSEERSSELSSWIPKMLATEGLDWWRRDLMRTSVALSRPDRFHAPCSLVRGLWQLREDFLVNFFTEVRSSTRWVKDEETLTVQWELRLMCSKFSSKTLGSGLMTPSKNAD